MKPDTLLAAILIGAAPLLPAADIPARGPIPFSTYDRNGDGSIAPDEFEAVRAMRMQARRAQGMPMGGAGRMPSFGFFDTDGNGLISPDELAAGQQKRRAMRMGGQGRGRSMPTFADFDTNGDGRLLEQEFYEARNRRIGERARQGYQMRNLGRAPSFQELDADGNGEVTPEEFAAHQARHRQQNMRRW